MNQIKEHIQDKIENFNNSQKDEIKIFNEYKELLITLYRKCENVSTLYNMSSANEFKEECKRFQYFKDTNAELIDKMYLNLLDYFFNNTKKG